MKRTGGRRTALAQTVLYFANREIFMKTENLWMCIGYHITWNYFQGDVFGFLVSGNVTDSIYTINTISPNIINGGSFGPEGGLVVTILLVITIFIIYRFLS